MIRDLFFFFFFFFPRETTATRGGPFVCSRAAHEGSEWEFVEGKPPENSSKRSGKLGQGPGAGHRDAKSAAGLAAVTTKLVHRDINQQHQVSARGGNNGSSQNH